ncbi:hypothetical protein V865_005285 [Kwoniella europaea PYCC6329]|uniref:Uncharacterized protein n=1 Tax=Kwoniella europaea PYCC6329 TaxID=1423913 RepID=A0AAX4KNA3_9TREE
MPTSSSKIAYITDVLHHQMSRTTTFSAKDRKDQPDGSRPPDAADFVVMQATGGRITIRRDPNLDKKVTEVLKAQLKHDELPSPDIKNIASFWKTSVQYPQGIIQNGEIPLQGIYLSVHCQLADRILLTNKTPASSTSRL